MLEEENGCFIDYLTFTVRYLEQEIIYELGAIPSLFSILGLNNSEFEVLDKAKNHYEWTHSWGKGYIKISTGTINKEEDKRKYLNLEQLHDAKNKGMILLESSVTMTGTGCREFINLSKERETLFEMLLRVRSDERFLVSKKHKKPIVFTRLDLTRDDYKGIISPAYVLEKTNKKEFVSRMDVESVIQSQKDENGSFQGMTVYFGNRSTSEFFIRFYDKTAERKNKGKATAENINISRVEMVFKKEQATAAVYKMFDYYDRKEKIGKFYSEILMSKVYFLEDNFSRVSDTKTNKRHIDKRWIDFTETTKRTRLCVSKEESTIENKKQYRKQSLPRPLATLSVAEGVENSLFILNRLVIDSIYDLKLEDEIQIKKYWKEKEPSLSDEALEEKIKIEKNRAMDFLSAINRFCRNYQDR